MRNVLIGIVVLTVAGVTYNELARRGIVPKLFNKKVVPPVVAPVVPPTAKPVTKPIAKPVEAADPVKSQII